ncbi:nuclear transport factor 2 family protein [Streptomyces mirabilis]|uniref:nuclear transport factor 2 family protein n=1 Tax=Streptomyces mirabilis TaxID=68239 RepID=UPI0036CB0E93
MTETQSRTVQKTGEAPGWVTELYACFDRMDQEAMLAHFSDDARIRFGNSEPTVGPEEIRVRFAATADTIRRTAHTFTQVWESNGWAMLLADVEYTCHNEKVMSLPAATVLHRRADGLIDDMQVFVDVTPLFAP